MNMKSSKHMVLFLLLNASVPDQSGNICNKVLQSPTARGERGRRKQDITWKGNSRATGDDEEMKESRQCDGCQGKRPWATSPWFTSTSIITHDTKLFTSLGLKRLCTGYTRGKTAARIPQPGSTEREATESGRLTKYFYFCLGLKFKEKPLGHVHLIIHDLYWRQVGSFIIQK